MKFIALINRTYPLGEAINALSHMTFGLGHRLKGKPDVHVYFGDSAQVRAFRSLASTLVSENPQAQGFSDFPHTMTGGDTDKQLTVGASTFEADMHYLGSCFFSEIIDQRLIKHLHSCVQFKDYKPYFSEESVSVRPVQNTIPYVRDAKTNGPPKKICMLINSKASFAKSLNAIILSSLGTGGLPSYADLKLLDVMDKNGNAHSNISYHPYPILKPSNPAKHEAMAKAASDSDELFSVTIREDQPLATVVFGERTKVEEVIIRKETRLFEMTLKDADLMPSETNSLSEHSTSNPEEKKSVSDNKEVYRELQSVELIINQQEKANAKIARIIDTVSDAAKCEVLDDFTLKLKSGIDTITKLQARMADGKSEQGVNELISESLSEASGGGNFAIVKFLLENYRENITKADIDHCAQYARCNSYESVRDLLLNDASGIQQQIGFNR